MKSLNEELFRDLGTTWHGVEDVELSSLGRRKLEQLRKLAQETLKSEYDGSASIVAKDPRMCRLLGLWQPVFTTLAARTGYPMILRNPLEVAQSLSQRNGFDPEYGLLLWVRYLLDAELGTRGLPRVALTFDQLLDDWQSVLERIARTLKIPIDASSVDGEKVADFLSTDLRHHRIADEQAFIELARFPQISEAYRVLLGWTTGTPESSVDFETLDRIRAELNRTGPMVSDALERARLDRKRMAGLKSQADETAAELARARRSTGDLDAIRATLAEQSISQARLEERLASAVTLLSDAIAKRTSLEEAVAEGLQVQDDLRRQIDRMREEAFRAAEEYGRSREISDEHHRREMDALAAKSEATARSQSERYEEAEQQIQRLAKKQDALETELKDVKRKYRSTQHQLVRDQEKLRKSQVRLAEAEAIILEMRQSLPWRISAQSAKMLHRIGMQISRALGGGDRKIREFRVAQIRRSSYFDAEWYLSKYPDVADSGCDAALHFLLNGSREGRDPGPEFSTSTYLTANPDVARSGQNPLLHYIEFGQSEGRSISARSPVPAEFTALAFNSEFGPAAPCANFPIAKSAPARWTRSFQLDGSRPCLVSIDGIPIGYLEDARHRASLQASFLELARFSGFPSTSSEVRAIEMGSVETSETLIDAWQTGDGRLRTRWSADGAGCIVRAYQHDPEKGGSLALLGEGLVIAATDFIDVNLRNPFFPLVFVLADPDGTIRGSKMLVFPSLCRGGAHFPELLLLAREANKETPSAIDILGHSEALSGHLRASLSDTGEPFLGGLEVDLNGGDGSEPLFQADIQAWLSKVLRIEVTSSPTPGDQRGVDYLAASIQVDGSRGKRGSRLRLSADMIPTISILVSSCEKGAPVTNDVVLPVVLAGSDQAKPATLAELPITHAELLRTSVPGYAEAWPRLVPSGVSQLGSRAPVAAIRQHRRAPTDAELLVPVAQPVPLGPQDTGAITWLVASDETTSSGLAQTIETLSLQAVSFPAAVSFLGNAGAEVLALARRLFPGRVSEFAEIDLALAAVETPFVGYIGANVTLHDNRTARVLSTILEEPAAKSASCVIVSAERRGKGWHAAIADQGTLAGVSGSDHPPKSALFWRSNYPASLPPRDFWLARTSVAAGWLQRAGPMRSDEGMHVCTSLVTAGYLAERGEGSPLLRPPMAQNAMRLESLL
ncbi:hypothetical protein [Sphingomonas daechungensis]|uniref:hypothetical protein n=1 Tax=Sphingomonas daechungensis TaxID=1176646 RepID=UPI0031E79D2E